MEILTIIISVFASVVSGSALFFLSRYFKRRDKKDEIRDKAAAKENILIMKSITALGKLAVANSIALKGGKSNGEMSAALKEFKAVERELYDYLLEQNAHK